MRPTPPQVRVLAGDVEIPAVLHSYDWTTHNAGGGMETSKTPPELVQARRIAPVPLPARSTLRFAFDPDPFEVRVYRWTEGQGKGLPVPVAPGETIRIPREPGVYVYEVSARWNQGAASYVFNVEVRGPAGSR